MHKLTQACQQHWLRPAPCRDGSLTDGAALHAPARPMRAQVNTWNIGDGNTDYRNSYISPSTAVRPSWAQFRSVSQASVPNQGTVTTLCFSRRLSEPSASVSRSITLDATQHMIWAYHSRRAYEQHDYSGSFDLNLGSGSLTVTTDDTKLQRMWVHGALMTVAWVGLLPLGALVARHK